MIGIAFAFAAALPSTPTVELTLERAIEQARENNPKVAAALQRIVAAEAGLSEARGSFSPTLQLGVSYGVSNNPAQVFANIVNQQAFDPSLNFNELPTVDDLNLNATLQVPIWIGGRRFAARDAAELARDASKEEVESVRSALAFQVTRAYYGVQKARGFVRAATAAVEAFEGNARIARERFEQGTLLKQALLDVEVRLARAREDLILARNAEALAVAALATVVGVEGDVVVAEASPALTIPREEGGVAERPELKAVEFQVARSAAAVDAAEAGYLPSVQAFATGLYNYGFENDGDSLSYVVGVGVSWTAWDGLATRARVRRAEAAAGEARSQRLDLERNLELEVTQARIRLDDALERLRVTEQEIALAEESAMLARARFEEGVALATELIDAETNLTAAKTRRVESEANRWIAVAALRKALGLSIVEKGNS